MKTTVVEELPASWSVPEALRGLALYEADQRLCVLWGELYGSWVRAYPSLDLMREIAAAHAWEVANPQKQKTSRGRPRFLAAWLERSQNRGGARKPLEDPSFRERVRGLDEQQRRRALEARQRAEVEPMPVGWLLDAYKQATGRRAEA